MRGTAIIAAAGVIFAMACTSVGEYSTDPGDCYRGAIVDADYLLSPLLPPKSEIVLVLDANALGEGEPGTAITTSNLLFDRAPVLQMEQLASDSLSLLEFPSGRVRNFLAFAKPTSGPPATVVISLMEDEKVEVRIMRPDLDPDDGEDTAIFGVFSLERKEGCGY